MTKPRDPSAQKAEDLAKKAAETTVALNPVVGMNPADLISAFGKTAAQAAKEPLKMWKHSAAYTAKLMDIAMGKAEYAPGRGDRRFKDAAWEDVTFYHNLLQSYLALRETLGEWLADADFDPLERRQAEFALSLIGDSISPTNTLAGNPAAIKKAVETNGKSLIDGLGHYLDDLWHNGGMPSQVDKSKFQVGGNIATTPGEVVFQNDRLELIQYRPQTDRVYSIPLLIVPPQINKYYVFDLAPEKSFMQYCINAGLQTFVISWKNPGPANRNWGIEDYLQSVLEALKAVGSITRRKKINLMGACSGGITASIVTGYLEAIGVDLINSLSLSVCVLSQHREDSDMSIFINPQRVEMARRQSKKKGVLQGGELSRVFNWMRPNDLIWNYVVNNYLMGQKPPAFDILYWNNDTTNLPANLHSDFLDIIAGNALEREEGVRIADVPIDLSKSECDKYIVAGITDHITPWQACYRNTQILGGNIRFILSSSGHIQSLINPPGNPKAKYFASENIVEDAEEWASQAEELSGTWWQEWVEWLGQRSGNQKGAPRKPGNTKYPPIEPAPGSYVLEQVE